MRPAGLLLLDEWRSGLHGGVDGRDLSERRSILAGSDDRFDRFLDRDRGDNQRQGHRR